MCLVVIIATAAFIASIPMRHIASCTATTHPHTGMPLSGADLLELISFLFALKALHAGVANI
jgi:hypothetical protein